MLKIKKILVLIFKFYNTRVTYVSGLKSKIILRKHVKFQFSCPNNFLVILEGILIRFWGWEKESSLCQLVTKTQGDWLCSIDLIFHGLQRKEIW